MLADKPISVSKLNSLDIKPHQQLKLSCSRNLFDQRRNSCQRSHTAFWENSSTSKVTTITSQQVDSPCLGGLSLARSSLENYKVPFQIEDPTGGDTTRRALDSPHLVWMSGETAWLYLWSRNILHYLLVIHYKATSPVAPSSIYCIELKLILLAVTNH